MKRFIIVTTALVISAALVSSVSAQSKGKVKIKVNLNKVVKHGKQIQIKKHNIHHNHQHHNHNRVHHNHGHLHHNHGHFHHQRIVHVRHHHYRSWAHYCYLPRYGCYGYYCPSACGWYYWYAPGNCYLPISHIQQYAPTPVANPNFNPYAANILPNVNGLPALPPGATPLPGGATPPLPGIGS